MPSRDRADGAAPRHLTFAPHWTVSVVPGEGVLLRGDVTTTFLEGAIYEDLAPLLARSALEADIVRRLSRRHDAAGVWYALLQLEHDGLIGAVARAGRLPSAGRLVVRRHRGITVALVDDYLQAGLARLNRRSLRSGLRWAIASPAGELAWAGPRFEPGRSACWQCLADRLRMNRPVERFLSDRGIVPTRRAQRGTVSSLLIDQATATTAIGVLWTHTNGSDLWTPHAVDRRPECPACGDPFEYRRRVLKRQAVTATTDLESIRRRASPLTGLVHSVSAVRAAPVARESVWIAPAPCPGRPASIGALRQVLEWAPSGKSWSVAAARSAAIGEAIERRSGIFTGDEPRRRASFASLGNRAVHPNACMLFSEAQFRTREKWNARESPFAWVPRPLDERLRLDWTPVWSLTDGTQRFLPTSYLYYDHPEAALGVCHADSNGCAAGRTLSDAARSALLELVERDAVAIWWYNRVRRPALPLGIGGPRASMLARGLRSSGRTLWLLDLTTDLGIPVVGAISHRPRRQHEEIVFGFAAHTKRSVAAQRALAEMTQLLASIPEAGIGRDALEPEVRAWLAEARLGRNRWLAPALQARSTDSGEVSPRATLHELVSRLAGQGLEVMLLDQTRAECGVPVARVIVPGLRPFWPRLAPGRLYDVPVAAGWATKPTRERDMNPIAFFL